MHEVAASSVHTLEMPRLHHMRNNAMQGNVCCSAIYMRTNPL